MHHPQAYTCPLFLEPPSHLPPHPVPLSCQSTELSPCVTQQVPTGYFNRYHECISMLLSQAALLSPSLSVSTSLFSMPVSPCCPANRFISTSYQDDICCSVAKSCLALCYPMDCGMPTSPVLHSYPEFAQMQHLVSQWCYLTTSSSAALLSFCLWPFFSISVFSSESALHIRGPKYWSFSFSMSSSNTYFKHLFIFVNWRIIALQYCIGFYRTSTCISHRFTNVPFRLNVPPNSPHPTALGGFWALV